MEIEVSHKLDRVLDALGFQKSIIRLKMTESVGQEIVANAFVGPLFSTLRTGSFGECFSGDFYFNCAGSDFDIMIIFHEMLFIINENYNLGDITLEHPFIVQIETVNVPSGYVKLVPKIEESVALTSSLVQKVNGHLYLSSERALSKIMPFHKHLFRTLSSDKINEHLSFEKHGPSSSVVGSYKGELRKRDIVCGFTCNFWPKQAEEWKLRSRKWPTQAIIDEIISNGCHLVPTGFPGSESENLEWRFSMALAERHLMWSLNNSQRKCYSLLKILNREFICKGSIETLTSYHFKTAFLWTLEELESSVWKSSNLLHCLHLCLSKLLDFVRVRNCPNYFISNANLFDRPCFDTENCQKIIHSLSMVLNDITNILFSCPILSLIQNEISEENYIILSRCHLTLQWLLVNKCYYEEVVSIVSDNTSFRTMMKEYRKSYSLSFNMYVKETLEVTVRDPMLDLYRKPFALLNHTFLGILHQIEISKMAPKDDDEYEITRMYVNDAVSYFQKGVRDRCLTGSLRLANFYFTIGLFKEAKHILDGIDNNSIISYYNIGCDYKTIEKKILFFIQSLIDGNLSSEKSISAVEDAYELVEELCKMENSHDMENLLSRNKEHIEYKLLSWLTIDVVFYVEEINWAPYPIQFLLALKRISDEDYFVCDAKVLHLLLKSLTYNELRERNKAMETCRLLYILIHDIPESYQDVSLHLFACLLLNFEYLFDALCVLSRSYEKKPDITIFWMFGVLIEKLLRTLSVKSVTRGITFVP